MRAAEALISREPLVTFAAGLAATFLPILVIVGLFLTVIGAPLAMGILFGLWPLAAFVGYLVAGIWVGDWLRCHVGIDRDDRRGDDVGSKSLGHRIRRRLHQRAMERS